MAHIAGVLSGARSRKNAVWIVAFGCMHAEMTVLLAPDPSAEPSATGTQGAATRVETRDFAHR